ncbi:MAG: hypothetical protein HY242_16310 [Afipia sp.]|nr:hypothetical protein [Afipia sp.]
MKKIALMFVAAATVALAVPASAETVVIKQGGMHRHHGWNHARAEWRHDRGWHRGWYHRGPAVVIKR